MAWNIKNFAADGSFNLEFKGHGSIFIEGTFGGGTLSIYPVGVINETGTLTTSATAIDSLTAAGSKELPNGLYSFVLSGATAPNLNLWHSANNIATR